MESNGRKADAAGEVGRGRGWWIAALVLLAIGLALSVELVRLHIQAAADAEYHSYCAVNETVSCDTVARSEYAIFLGVPLAVWGVFGYVLMAVIAGIGLRRRSRAPALLFAGLAVFSLVVSAVLAAISHFLIHAWCLVCIGTYAVNLVVMVPSFLLLRKEGVRAGFRDLSGELKHWLAVAGVAGGVTLGLILLYPPPAPAPSLLPSMEEVPEKTETSTSEASQAATTPATEAEEIPMLEPGIEIQTGVTEEGLPWIGAADPVVTITEFFDYECSHCKQAFYGMHRLLEANPDRLRLVIRHFPLSSVCNSFISRPIYPHSCVNAKLATCAAQQDHFWEAHEYLFEHGREDVAPAAFAKALSLNLKKLKACMKQDNEALNRDIAAGNALELHGTPVFVIDGQVYLQRLPRFLAKKLRPPAPRR